MSDTVRRSRRKSYKREGLSFGTVLLRIFSILGYTVASVLLFVILVLFVVLKGPSKDAARLLTLSCYETSAIKWVPRIFMSEEEYASIIGMKAMAEEEIPETEAVTEAETVAEKEPETTDSFKLLPVYSADGEIKEAPADEPVSDLPIVEVITLRKQTFKGKLMLVRDPSLVQIGSIDTFGSVGLTLSSFLDKYDAIGCTNAGGFVDEGGHGKGGIPDGIVIRDGAIVYGSAGGYYQGFVGFDREHKLHVGAFSGQQALDAGIVSGTSFAQGPTLIKDGTVAKNISSGINPRTAIGQTEDGTVILMAVEGRMADSLGATYEDIVEIMQEYGAVNAANLDGGSSSGMYYEGERITRSSSVVGDRPLPTAIIVMKP